MCKPLRSIWLSKNHGNASGSGLEREPETSLSNLAKPWAKSSTETKKARKDLGSRRILLETASGETESCLEL